MTPLSYVLLMHNAASSFNQNLHPYSVLSFTGIVKLLFIFFFCYYSLDYLFVLCFLHFFLLHFACCNQGRASFLSIYSVCLVFPLFLTSKCFCLIKIIVILLFFFSSKSGKITRLVIVAS